MIPSLLGIDDLREKRNELAIMLEEEEEEKARIQNDMVVLTKRLSEIDESLASKYAYINEYDKTIEDVEAAYGKVTQISS
jgi:Sjoegren syndrome nuclear autoantigen 1